MAFGRKVGRFATRAAQGALLAAPSANPYVIGGSALLSGAPALFEEDRKFDPKPFRRGFRKYAAARRSGARRTADEAGSQAGSMLASRGMADSPLATGIAAGQRRLALQRTEDILGAEEGQLEGDLARAEEEVRIANAQDQREAIEGVGSAALALTHNVTTTDSPLREALGLPVLAPAPAPITINTGGGDSGGGDSGGGNTPATTTTKKGTEIPQGSMLNEWYQNNPDIVDELEDLLGSDLITGLGF